jgi:cation diffusion facilitator CzcD-associated flavoprotein CzcO
METFPGKILHSYEYKSGKNFKGQRVLVVGFGNSACEIAIDLHEQGATTCNVGALAGERNTT